MQFYQNHNIELEVFVFDIFRFVMLSLSMIDNLRQYRIGGYAIFDLAVSFLGVYLLSPLLSGFFRFFHVEVPKQNWVFLTLPMSILVHLAVNNRTLMTKNFLDLQGHFLLKILIIALTIWGLWGIKIVK